MKKRNFIKTILASATGLFLSKPSSATSEPCELKEVSVPTFDIKNIEPINKLAKNEVLVPISEMHSTKKMFYRGTLRHVEKSFDGLSEVSKKNRSKLNDLIKSIEKSRNQTFQTGFSDTHRWIKMKDTALTCHLEIYQDINNDVIQKILEKTGMSYNEHYFDGLYVKYNDNRYVLHRWCDESMFRKILFKHYENYPGFKMSHITVTFIMDQILDEAKRMLALDDNDLGRITIVQAYCHSNYALLLGDRDGYYTKEIKMEKDDEKA